MMKITKLIGPLVLAFAVQSASAAIVNSPLPDGSYISNYDGSGLDVAWAGPCAIFDPSCGVADLSFQSAFGWRLATPGEIAGALSSLQATDFVFAGANVPLGGSSGDGATFQSGVPGGDAACASPYFSNLYSWCDWNNAPGPDQISGYTVVWSFGQAGEEWWTEAILVRDSVPEPATLALFGAGLLGLGLRRRKVA